MCDSKSMFFCMICLQGNEIHSMAFFYELEKTGRQFIHGVI